MLYASILILLFWLFLYIISLSYKDKIPQKIDKKKHGLHFLYPMAGFILSRIGLKRKLLNKSEISRKIRALYASDNYETQVRLYWYQKTSLILLIILSFSVLTLITSIQSVLTKSHSFEAYLIRPEEGEGDSRITLKFRMEKEADKGDIYEDEIIIYNRERIYTESEWHEALDRAITYLEREMLGENEAADYIYMDLDFIKNIPGTGITVEWWPKDQRLVTGSGKVINEGLGTSATTLVTAILKYRDKSVEHTIPLTILPMDLTSNQRLYKELQSTLDVTEKETGMSKKWFLPKSIEDYILTWEVPKDNTARSVFVIGIFGVVLVWFFKEKELDNHMKLRKNQMLLDYPEIINKFNLLVNAGMTIKQAWSKISLDYKNKTDIDIGYKRYAYEEMLLTMHELKLGIPEASAYEQFGMRVGLLPYMKFSSMIVQNLRKGNRNMIDLLKQEAIEAFQERKETTKKLGEEASTKLLLPMLIMLLIVLTIIMIPAFISFRI